MNMPAFLRPLDDGVELAVKVQPRASRNRIGEALGPELRIWVSAPPVDAAANEAVLLLVADTLGCPRRAIELIRGQASRHKRLRIRGVRPETVLARLRGCG